LTAVSGWEKETLEYPERTKRIKMLRFLLDELRKAYSRREDELKLIYRWNKWSNRWDEVTIRATGVSIPSQLGLNAPECKNLLSQLSSEGYIRLYRQNIERSRQEKERYAMPYLTDKGLRELGELPDPQAQLIQGFDAAIEAIKRDRSLPDAEKGAR
jgi:hypothetical protein